LEFLYEQHPNPRQAAEENKTVELVAVFGLGCVYAGHSFGEAKLLAYRILPDAQTAGRPRADAVVLASMLCWHHVINASNKYSM